MVLALALLVGGTAFADDDIRVGVLRFSSSTVDVGSEQAAIIGEVFTQRLAMADTLSIVGYEELASLAAGKRLQTTGYFSTKNAAQIGQLAECKYIVAGNITDLKMKSSSSGIHFIGSFGSHKEEASAAADIRVIDVETGDAIATFSEKSRAAQSGSYVGIAGVSSGQSDLNGMQQAAISELATKICVRVRDVVGDPVVVTNASAKSVTLGIGNVGGAAKGSLFRIYTGNANRGQTLAVVKVSNADSETSTAALADKNSGNLSLVRKGDKIVPTDADELKALQKGKKFAKSRPKEI